MLRTPLALLAIALTTSFALAQTDAPPTAEPKRQEAPKSDEAVNAYLKSIAPHIANDNAVIRRSAQQAFAAVGMPALPTLKDMSAGKDEKLAGEAKRLIARIERAGSQEQRPGGMGGRMGGNPAAMVERLELSPEQEIKAVEILNKQNEKLAELMDQVRSGEVSREEMRDLMQEQRDATLKALEKVIPADKMGQVREALSGGMGGRGGPGGQGGGEGGRQGRGGQRGGAEGGRGDG